MLAFSGAMAELYRMTAPGAPSVPTPREDKLLMLYLGAMVVLAWATVFSGAYVVYPWYRAVPPPGLADPPTSRLSIRPRTPVVEVQSVRRAPHRDHRHQLVRYKIDRSHQCFL